MYKVTLWDMNMPSCTSGVFTCYCDDIDEFEKEWRLLEDDENTIDRFKRSKAGEIVTDYYSNDPALDIVQHDPNCEMYFENNISLEDFKVEVLNGYGWKTELFIIRCDVDMKYIKFKEKFYLIARHKILGVCRDFPFTDKEYETVKCYGNPVIKRSAVETKYSDDKSDFSEDTIESFVYYPIYMFEAEEEMKQDYKKRKRRKNFFTKDELNWLFTDIPRESG